MPFLVNKGHYKKLSLWVNFSNF